MVERVNADVDLVRRYYDDRTWQRPADCWWRLVGAKRWGQATVLRLRARE